MSLIRCPECGTRISDKATTCPFCGYVAADAFNPISAQEQYKPKPTIQSIGERWEIIPISDEDSSIILTFLSNYENLKVVAPGIADAVASLLNTNTQFVADISAYTQSLIDKGVLEFLIDGDGRILSTIKNADTQKITEIVRLKEVTNCPELSGSLTNLSNQVAMAQIMDELKLIEEKMANIQKELQEDRLAMADSAWDKVLQARCIEDRRLKAIAIQNAINSATDAKRVLMRNFTVSLEASIKSKKPKEAETKAQDAAKDLVALTNCVHIECDGYAYLGEPDASVACLKEFLDFVKANNLDDRNTLLRLNENLPVYCKIPTLNEDFQGVVAKVAGFVGCGEEEKRLEG